MAKLDYASLSDEELAVASSENDEACSALISRYLPSVRRLARMYTKSAADRDDLVSEGILGLLSAVKTFSAGRGASFSTYAGTCMNNRMLSSLKKSARIRSREEALEDISVPEGSSPEKIVLDREFLGEIFSEISENLSELERSVIGLYLSGASYADITRSLGIDRKAVDNALSRVRRRLRKKFR